MKKSKILIISYGGTIVMVVDESKKAVVPADNIQSIIRLVPDLNRYVDTEMVVLSNKDSTNVSLTDWSRISSYIKEHYDEYDGFLVTHGTNTLAYTATAISLAFGKNLSKPIVLTGSQLPLTVYGNDARFNLENSLHVLQEAVDKKIHEVMVVFDTAVLRGNRTLKVSESSFDAFDSPAYPHLATINSTGIAFNEAVARTGGRPSSDITLRNDFDNHILAIDIFPGLDPDKIFDFIISNDIKGLIVKSLGAGSVPTEGSGSFLPVISRLTKDHGVPVIVATKFLGGTSYKTTNDEPALLAIEAGAIPANEMTDVTTEVKLMWLLGRGFKSIEDVRRLMHFNYIGEIN